VRKVAWQSNKKISVLWTDWQGGNAWVLVDGLGWRKIVAFKDDVHHAMFIMAAHAKGHDRFVDFFEFGVGGDIEIHELYVF
jgi:hypothetical protein